jgi:cobyrinic acid a,c-diamide synthase
MRVWTPRLVIAGLAGDSGKTLVSSGLARLWTARGLSVAPFKKGPDYIDAAWLGAATRRPGRNLDTFLMTSQAIGEALARGAARADVAVVEGNRGLFDGLDAEGSHSTAELAKLIRAPVVLVVDVAKSTRTVAAMVVGCRVLDGALNLAGVVLNRVGSARHEQVIRDAIAAAGGPPVLGAIPRLQDGPFPGRHLGLLTAAEHPAREQALDAAAELVGSHVDVEALLACARSAPAVELPSREPMPPTLLSRIAVLRDEALSFYYPENLEALEEAGAELSYVSPLAAEGLPPVDAVYVGGGFPEVHAERLSRNARLQNHLRKAASAGIPIYAECGGLMYLAKELRVDGVGHPMAGVLDLTVEHTSRPQGHGYVSALVDRMNPFFERGAQLHGHEFHYSRVLGGSAISASVVRLERGTGLGDGRDGIVAGNVWASYFHIHALGTRSWAPAFVALAREYRDMAAHQAASAGGGEARG